MEASKVIISQDMQDYINNPKISTERRMQLRADRVVEYIKSKPAGEYIKKLDLVHAAGYVTENNRARGYSFIDSLISSKKISCHQDSRTRMSWSVNDSKISNTEKPSANLDKPKKPPIKDSEEPSKNEIDIPRGCRVKKQLADIKYEAQQFAWNYSSDSLREFINYLERERKI